MASDLIKHTSDADISFEADVLQADKRLYWSTIGPNGAVLAK